MKAIIWDLNQWINGNINNDDNNNNNNNDNDNNYGE